MNSMIGCWAHQNKTVQECTGYVWTNLIRNSRNRMEVRTEDRGNMTGPPPASSPWNQSPADEAVALWGIEASASPRSERLHLRGSHVGPILSCLLLRRRGHVAGAWHGGKHTFHLRGFEVEWAKETKSGGVRHRQLRRQRLWFLRVLSELIVLSNGLGGPNDVRPRGTCSWTALSANVDFAERIGGQ